MHPLPFNEDLLYISKDTENCRFRSQICSKCKKREFVQELKDSENQLFKWNQFHLDDSVIDTEEIDCKNESKPSLCFELMELKVLKALVPFLAK